MPERVQLSRAKGYRMPPNTVKVDRSTRWGNPFNATQIGVAFGQHGLPAPIVYLRTEPSLDRCLDMHLAFVYAQLYADPKFLEPLRGKNLACWCKLGEPCHVDTLLRLANDMNGVSAEKKVTAKITKKQARMEKAVAWLAEYMRSYDKQIGYQDYEDKTFIDDVLYGLGVALRGTVVASASGYDKWRQMLRDHLDEA